MALVSLSSDIEERREAALAEIGRLRAEIELASDFGPSDAQRLHDRCKEILSAFQHLADKMLLAPSDVHLQLTELDLKLRQASERADGLQLKFDAERSRTGKAIDEANKRVSNLHAELDAVRRKAANKAASDKLTIADLQGRLAHWRRVAQGEVLSFKPGPRTPQPGKTYRKPRKAPATRAPAKPTR